MPIYPRVKEVSDVFYIGDIPKQFREEETKDYFVIVTLHFGGNYIHAELYFDTLEEAYDYKSKAFK